METPRNKAGRLTDRVMLAIYEHVRREPPPQESHHYNRAYEKIYAILRTSLPGGLEEAPRDGE